MVFQCINIRQIPREVLKTAAFSLSFQHLPPDLANVNAWKNMFDPYIKYSPLKFFADLSLKCTHIWSIYFTTSFSFEFWEN